MSNLEWFRTRGYRHFDVPVDSRFAARAMEPGFAARHSFSPFLHFTKETKQYRPKSAPGKVRLKRRPIMYASHRDACIFSYYSSLAARALEGWYARENLTEQVVAYRRLGKANYHFAADAVLYARRHSPCQVLAFDVTQFFDTLDHSLLKTQLKAVLGVAELSPDWFAVFRQVTSYRYVEMEKLKANATVRAHMDRGEFHPLVDIRFLKAASFVFEKNPNKIGIPQGSPISSTLANVYMMEFDKAVAAWCQKHDAFFRRYSDDILVICDPADATAAEAFVLSALAAQKLATNPAKTERTTIDASGNNLAQYLGFSFGYGGVSIRPSSMSKQWRKLKRATRKIEEAGRTAVASGKANKIYTKKLRRKFSGLRLRNFPSYARRASDVLDSKTIKRQTRRIERRLEEIIRTF